MSPRLRILVPVLLLATGTMQAGAADYEPPVVDMPVIVQDAPEFVPVEIGSGWYLRGDVGYAITNATGNFTFRSYDAGAYTPGTFATGAYSGDLTLGVGFGYRFTDMLRADVTADNFSLRFNGTRGFGSPCPGENAGTTCAAQDASSVNAWSIMANGYVDLGTIAGFTPYLGVGAGMTYANWGTATSTYACASGPCAFGARVLTHEGIDSWRFTYQAMAGFAYDVSRNLKLDFGYTFRHVGGGDMFGFTAASQLAGASGVEASDPGFNQHVFKVGLRYELW
jgi:opacity protein-like surface antigen